MLLNVLVLLMVVAVLTSTAKNMFVQREANDNSIGFLGKDNTAALRGFAIIMIAFSHICQYEKSLKETLIGGGDYVHSSVLMWRNRCFVVLFAVWIRMFLIYSKS